jgi:hypothetical protein
MVLRAPKSLVRRNCQVQARVMNRVCCRRLRTRTPSRQVVRQPHIPIELVNIKVIFEYDTKSLRAL